MNSALVLISATLAILSAKKDKPNVILILMDDLGYSDVGYNGGNIPTASINELAENGIRLNYNYVEFVCSATRSSLLTGRYAHKTGVNDGIAFPNRDHVDDSLKFISNALTENNYDTLMVGKWHIGYSEAAHLPSNRGFQQSLYFKNGQINYDDHRQCFPWGGITRSGLISGEVSTPPTSFLIPSLMQVFPEGYCGYDLFEDDQSYVDMDTNEYLEDILSDKIIDFINDKVTNYDKTPFFIYWSMLTPHVPLIIPPETAPECNALPSSTPQEQERMKECNAMFYADKLIGDVVSTLKTNNIYDDTVIIFLSDNGPQVYIPFIAGGAGNPLPLRGAKLSPFEGGIRTAGIIGGGYIENDNKWRKYADCDYNNMVHVSDYYAIIAGFANLKKKDDSNLGDIDGINLLPDIRKECKSPSAKGPYSKGPKGKGPSSKGSKGSKGPPSSDANEASESLDDYNYGDVVSRDGFVSVRYCNIPGLIDDQFQRSIVFKDGYKLVVNPDEFGCDPIPNSFNTQLAYLKYWVPYDSAFTTTPNQLFYDEFNDANINNPIFYSECYENDNFTISSTLPYTYNGTNQVYLFDIKSDNIEACNIAADNLDIVHDMFDMLETERDSSDFNQGAGALNTEKGAIMSDRDSYNCDNQLFTYTTWYDDPQYQTVNIDWTTIFLSYMAEVQMCPP